MAVSMIETTCNTTLQGLLTEPGSDITIAGPLTFHSLAMLISGSCSIIAIFLSLYLAFMHAVNYTKPNEQRQIIRILFLVPIYVTSSFLQIYFYRYATYFKIMSDCYEVFALASFFNLLCHFVAPDLHEQKEYFRNMYPIRKWAWPLSWFAACCGGQRGPWRTPKSGLTWFNVHWVGIYQYCLVRVAATATAVVTQYFDRYCESSNSPVFAHIWVLAINSVAALMAMYCLFQFAIQMRDSLDEHRLILKVVTIIFMVFLSFFQITAASIATTEKFRIIQPNWIVTYSDIKIAMPAMLMCFEMALFAILNLWAFSYSPYVPDAPTTFYPHPDSREANLLPPKENPQFPPSGGRLGVLAFLHAASPLDLIKGVSRGLRWLCCGVRRRKEDPSYENKRDSLDLSRLANPDTTYGRGLRAMRSTEHLPIADQFRRSRFGLNVTARDPPSHEEDAGLMAHAQPNPTSGTSMGRSLASPLAPSSPYTPSPYSDRMPLASPYSDMSGSPLPSPGPHYYNHQNRSFTERQRNNDWNPGTPRGAGPSRFNDSF